MRRGKEGSVLLGLGMLLILAAMLTAGYYLWEDYLAGRAVGENLAGVLAVIDNGTSDGYDAHNTRVDSIYARGLADARPLSSDQEETAVPDYLLDKNMEMPVEIINGIGYIGVLKIPSVDRELPVIAKYKYEDLATSPCRYSGSAYTDDMVICGHSYISHFRPIRNLKNGDAVIFEDVDGNVFNYTVGITEILKPTDVDRATNGEWDLTLFTCTSDSSSRFTVRCMRDGSDVKIMDGA